MLFYESGAMGKDTWSIVGGMVGLFGAEHQQLG